MSRLGGRMVWTILAGLLCPALTTLDVHAEGEKADPRVYEPAAKVEGKSCAEWSAAWWQWSLGIKKDKNPVLDKTGTLAGVGQDGPVWFLAGNVGGATIRKCVVPASKPLFFPVLSSVDGAPLDKVDEKRHLAEVKSEMDRATDMEATLDGKPISGLERYRIRSDFFTFTGPDKAADALFEEAAGKQRAVSDGYWVMVKPLPPGKHTLRFKGKLKAVNGKEPFDLDVTYELIVEAKK